MGGAGAAARILFQSNVGETLERCIQGIHSGSTRFLRQLKRKIKNLPAVQSLLDAGTDLRFLLATGGVVQFNSLGHCVLVSSRPPSPNYEARAAGGGGAGPRLPRQIPPPCRRVGLRHCTLLQLQQILDSWPSTNWDNRIIEFSDWK